MKTIILPGYSPHNRDWAEDIKKDLSIKYPVTIHEWRHWTSGSFSLVKEIVSILKKVGKEKINIIAKSVGTRVAMHLATKIPKQINKVILCGIPTRGESDTVRETYSKGLASLSPTQVIVFQNTKDPFANYKDIEKFIHSINPKINVVEKSRSDHHYPFSEDFEKFLT